MKLLFDQTDRQIIARFYRNQKQNKPLVVTQFEITKAKKDFERAFEPYLKPIVEFLNARL